MKVWTTRDGKKIPFDKLEVSHIFNIIKYAEKHGFVSYRCSTSICDNTDNEDVYSDISSEVISDMKEELRRRGIVTIYYVAKVTNDNTTKRVSVIFYDFKKALENIRDRYSRDYILIKEEII